MKILLSNKFYYPKGGDCIHALGLEELLRKKGHDVAFFAMQHSDNIASEYSCYFPSEIDYLNKDMKNLGKKILRPINSFEVKRKFRLLLKDFTPDIVHVHNIHSQISPIIVREAYKRKIPVIWTVHDYKLLCPRYDCRRDDKPCELCFEDKRNVIKYKCVKDSHSASILAYAEAKVWNREKLSKYTEHFICPSEFIRQKMIEGGFDPNILTTVNNFINTINSREHSEEMKDYYCYVGRLSKEKGVETLLKAAKELPDFKLKIIGTGPQYNYFTQTYRAPNIEFCGFKSSREVEDILVNSRFSVMPSECYENNPLAVIESLCFGTPVIGANTGGIPELITNKKNGRLFHSGDKNDLISKIQWLWDNGHSLLKREEISKEAINRFSKEFFYDRLFEIYVNAASNPHSHTQ